MDSYWSLGDSKSPQVSKTLVCIVAVLIMLYFVGSPIVFVFSTLFTNSLVIVPSAPIIIGITVTFMFHSFRFSHRANFHSFKMSGRWPHPETVSIKCNWWLYKQEFDMRFTKRLGKLSSLGLILPLPLFSYFISSVS